MTRVALTCTQRVVSAAAVRVMCMGREAGGPYVLLNRVLCAEEVVGQQEGG